MKSIIKQMPIARNLYQNLQDKRYHMQVRQYEEYFANNGYDFLGSF
jgi:hypothetical protein